MKKKKRIVTIGGAVGSGKSSVARKVTEYLAYEHFSSGDLFRKIARIRGVSIEDLNIAAETENDIDREVDTLLQRMGEEKHHLVIDSRLAYYWIPDSFKVYLALDEETAAERIFSQLEREERISQGASSLTELAQNIRVRRASEHKRYLALYGVDDTDLSPFDLVIDTKKYSLEEVVRRVLDGYEAWKRDEESL